MKVLLSAYACEPGKGSEPGAGWLWARAAAREHDVWVLTRANNRAAIEAALAVSPQPRLRFVYLDLPPRLARWKRGARGIRVYYVLWQLLAATTARRLHRRERFDVVHHLTFANVWAPALSCLVPAPFVLGPVGGGPSVPLRLYPALGLRGALRELAVRAARRASRLNPLVRVGWSRARVVLCQNDETLAALPARVRVRALVRPNAGAEPTAPATRAEPRTAVYAGRLLPWKGVALAVAALAEAPGWTLEVIGRGPDEARLRRLAQAEGVARRVRFTPWLPQAELAGRLASAAALVVPSLREDASLAAVEAQAAGVPVVAFDRGGPRALARSPGASIRLVPCGRRDDAVRGFAAALRSLEHERGREPVDFGAAGIADDLARVYASLRTTRAAAVGAPA